MAPRAPLLLLLLAACKATPPPAAPATPSTCIVALALRTDPDREAHGGRPRQAYFVKLSDDSDPMRQPQLLRSDFTADGVMYLLNAAPGRYAAVACYGKGQSEWTAYFPESFIRASEKQVPEGKAVLLGSFVMDLRSISTTGDAAQHHYMRVLWPDWEQKSAALKLFTRDNHAWGGPWRDLGDAKDVVARMKKNLGPEWASRFE